MKHEFNRVKNALFTPKSREGMMKSLEEYYLKNYFDGATDEEKTQMRSDLEKRLGESMDKYSSYLSSWTGRAAKAGGIIATLSDVYQCLLSKVPLTGAQYTPIRKVLVLAKTIPETFFMYNYFKDSHDIKGIIKWLGMKNVELAIPILGPLLGTGWTERIVAQRVMYETKRAWLKDRGLVEEKTPLLQRLDSHVKKITGYDITPRSRRPSYGLMPDYAY